MIRIAHRGDLISVLALRRRPAAAADLVGLDEGAIALWPGDLVMSLARVDAGLALDLLEHTLSSTARLLERLDRQSFDSVSRRLACVLWEDQALLFDQRRPLLSRPELADLAGATREMIDRVLRDFERRAIVARTGRSGLLLLDREGLRAQGGIDDAADPRDLEPCGREPLDEHARTNPIRSGAPG
jgi:CRP-like cAMP-binding protein